MVRLSRYILVLVALMAAATALPQLYWMLFGQPVRTPFVMYSCVDDVFMIQRNDDPIVREDTRGNTYTREEYEEKLPLLYMRQLMLSGTMYDTIRGIPVDAREVNMARSTFRYKPADRYTPEPGLYPLLESESGRANLEMPEDYFRITWRMEFIDAKTNRVNEEKSQLFSAALYHKGFQFPALKIAGLPTTRKSCDEGYLVVDAAEQLFHVKMVKGKPYVRPVELPEGLRFEHISCVDFRDKLYYAYLIDKNGETWILTQDDYELVKLPAGSFNPASEDLRIYGDLFHYNMIFNGDGFIRVVVLDKDYAKVDEYNETWKTAIERPEGKAFTWLFPGELILADDNSNFLKFRFEGNPVVRWIWLSLVLAAVHFLLLLRRKTLSPRKTASLEEISSSPGSQNSLIQPLEVSLSSAESRQDLQGEASDHSSAQSRSSLKSHPYRNNLWGHVADLAIVLLTGIFGFIAVRIFPNRFFD